MISYKKSKEILRKSKIKIGDEYVDTNNCLDRVTSSNIYVKSNYPLGNNAAFDGYAIKSIDTNKLHKKFYKKFKIIGSIAAGEAIEAIENANDFISVPSSMTSPNGKYFGLKVKGLSMIDEGIYDGDIAVIRKTNNVENGKIAAVLTQDNEVTLKTVKFEKNKVILVPANQSYQTKEYNVGEIQVQGTLSGIIRKYI